MREVQITAQEVVLEDVDVAAAILDYINKNHVAGIVLGASKRSPTARCIYIYIYYSLAGMLAANL